MWTAPLVLVLCLLCLTLEILVIVRVLQRETEADRDTLRRLQAAYKEPASVFVCPNCRYPVAKGTYR